MKLISIICLILLNTLKNLYVETLECVGKQREYRMKYYCIFVNNTQYLLLHQIHAQYCHIHLCQKMRALFDMTFLTHDRFSRLCYYSVIMRAYFQKLILVRNLLTQMH